MSSVCQVSELVVWFAFVLQQEHGQFVSWQARLLCELWILPQLYGYNGAGDRVIVSGNQKLRNWDFISAVDDPTYFPSTMYSIIGSETTAIMGYAIMSDGTQAIIKEWNGVDPSTYYRNGILLSDEQLFSVKEGSVNGGAIAKRSFAHANNEPLFLSNEGVKTIFFL